MTSYSFDQQESVALVRFFTVMTSALDLPEAKLEFTAVMPAAILDMSRVLGDLVSSDTENVFASKVPAVFPAREDLGLDFVDDLQNVLVALGAKNSSLVFVLPFVKQLHIDQQRATLIERVRKIGHDVVLVGREDLTSILTSASPLRQLRTFVLSQIDLTKVSPYRDAGPFPDHVFFGREAELSNICTVT